MSDSRRQHWQDRAKPFNGPLIELPFYDEIFSADFDRMRQGWLPNDMDDRWIGLISGDSIALYRSWTGFQIYRIPFVQSNSLVRVGPLFVTDDPSIYNRLSNPDDVSIVSSLIARYREACISAEPE